MRKVYFLIGTIFYIWATYFFDKGKTIDAMFCMYTCCYFLFNSYLHYKQEMKPKFTKEQIKKQLEKDSFGDQFVGYVTESIDKIKI